MRVLLDTGPLVALLNRRDAYHRWSVEQATGLQSPLYSCEAVITEAHHLLSGVPAGRERLIDLVDSGRIDLSFSYAEHATRVGELMLAYANVPMAFADACLVCLAERQESTVFTLDGDFHVYRLHGKHAITTIFPS